MNTLFNQKKPMLILFAALSMAACNSKQTAGETTETTGMEHADDHGHVHTYACPMHPDVQGHEGEKCSKCGMPLEHMDHAPVPGNFKMEFKSSGEKVEAVKATSLSFTPKNADTASVAVPLDV